MCFRVKESAPRPAQTKVYKILQELHGKYYSPHVMHRLHPLFSDGAFAWLKGHDASVLEWVCGDWKRPHSERNSDFQHHGSVSTTARAGMYVWLSLEAAKQDIPFFCGHYNVSPDTLVIAECSVHVTDWLYSGHCSEATYRAVRLDRILAKYRKNEFKLGYDDYTYEVLPNV
jgi:hypothetical protein